MWTIDGVAPKFTQMLDEVDEDAQNAALEVHAPRTRLQIPHRARARGGCAWPVLHTAPLLGGPGVGAGRGSGGGALRRARAAELMGRRQFRWPTAAARPARRRPGVR